MTSACLHKKTSFPAYTTNYNNPKKRIKKRSRMAVLDGIKRPSIAYTDSPYFDYDSESEEDLEACFTFGNFKQVCWKFYAFVCFMVLCRFSFKLIVKYQKYTTSFDKKKKYSNMTLFPSVTVCNNGKYFMPLPSYNIVRSWAIQNMTSKNVKTTKDDGNSPLTSNEDIMKNWALSWYRNFSRPASKVNGRYISALTRVENFHAKNFFKFAIKSSPLFISR